MVAQASCPDIACWQNFLDGALSAADHERLIVHLEVCPRCLEAMEQLTAAGRSWPATACCLDGDEASTPTALHRVLQELKESGSQPDPAPEPVGDSADPLPLLEPPRTPEYLV